MAKSKPKKNAGAVVERKQQKVNERAFAGELQRIVKEEYNNGMNQGYGIALLVLFWRLHVDYGFGKKRLLALMYAVNEFCSDVVKYDIPLQDVADQLAEECDIHIDTGTWWMDVPGMEVVKGDANQMQSV